MHRQKKCVYHVDFYGVWCKYTVKQLRAIDRSWSMVLAAGKNSTSEREILSSSFSKHHNQ